MSSSRASVSQLDSLMAGIVGSSDLFASAAASTIGTSTTAEGAAFQRAVNDNMEALDLKMAFEVFKTQFDFDNKATELSHNICLITRDEYKRIATEAGQPEAEAHAVAEQMAAIIQPKCEAATKAASALIINKLEEFLDEQEAANVADQTRISMGIHRAV